MKDTQKIYEEYLSGVTMEKLGKKYNVTNATISYWFKKAGLKTRTSAESNKKSLKFPIEEAWELYESGKSLAFVSSKYKVDRHRLKQEFVDAGHKIRNPYTTQTKDFPVEEAWKLYESGMSLLEIGKRYNLSFTRTSKKLRDAGYRIRNRKENIKKFYADIPLEEAWELYESGKTLEEVSDNYDVMRSTLFKFFERNGKKVRKSSETQKINVPIDDLYESYKSGTTLSSLSKQYDVSITTIFRRFEENGYKTHGNQSELEKELFQFIKTVYSGDIIKNTKSIINPYELDLYLPDLNLAIEFNGIYWHSEKFKSNSYHQDKWKLCQKQNIRLIQVWEHDWVLKKQIIQNYLEQVFNHNINKVYARKCDIKLSTYQQTKDFIDKNHIQGSTTSGVLYYGLTYNDDLVQVMSFIKHKDKWEIGRLCTKSNTQVIGGAQRLFKAFLKYKSPNHVFTYTDIGYFTGTVYEKLGFELSKITTTGYFYTKNKKSSLLFLSRQQCQKHKLIKQGFDKNKSEHQIMLGRGYLRVFNVGNKRFDLFIQT